MKVMAATSLGNREGRDGEPAREFQFQLHSPQMTLPADVVGYAHDKLRAKLAKFGSRVLGVIVRLKDVNGRKGGVDKACHMEAMVAGCEPVNVEELHADLRAAMDVATLRLEEAVHRHLERTRKKERERGRKVVRRRKLLQPAFF